MDRAILRVLLLTSDVITAVLLLWARPNLPLRSFRDVVSTRAQMCWGKSRNGTHQESSSSDDPNIKPWTATCFSFTCSLAEPRRSLQRVVNAAWCQIEPEQDTVCLDSSLWPHISLLSSSPLCLCHLLPPTHWLQSPTLSLIFYPMWLLSFSVCIPPNWYLFKASNLRLSPRQNMKFGRFCSRKAWWFIPGNTPARCQSFSHTWTHLSIPRFTHSPTVIFGAFALRHVLC